MNRIAEIKEITSEQANVVIDTREPLGLYYLLEDGGYIGIDNSTGDAWTEEFPNLRQCKEWLINPPLSV